MRTHRKHRTAFTLVELLIVLLIFTVLAGISLPIVKSLVSDQKIVNSARGLSAFMQAARSRAISEGRPTGILIERLDTTDTSSTNPLRASAIRFRQLVGVPPYSGDSSDSRAALAQDPNWPPVGHYLRPNSTSPDPFPGVDTAVFLSRDNQLLWLSALNPGPGAPIQVGDLLELPGGRTVPISQITLNTPTGSNPQTVTVRFTMGESLGGGGTIQPTETFPSAWRATDWTYPVGFSGLIPASAARAKFKVHRRPVVSQTAIYDFPRGVSIDLNYSGIGVSGNEFAPVVGTAASNISIIFGPDGKVINYTDSTGSILQPTGLMFLCVGTLDGVRPDNLVLKKDKEAANVANLDSTWVVVNPSTGRVFASPFAAATLPTATITNPYDGNLDSVITGARFLALLSDTVDAK